MGIEPPFLYDKPSKYSFVSPTDRPFNPKAATQAAWTPKPPRPKPNGPLINELNRHPDSYFVVPYGNLNWKPMSKHTKAKVKWLRILQLFLRICALLGAAGLLAFVICIKPVGNTLDWIIRIPPGFAILHTVYAIYHLCRSANGRTPASTASYMIFASILDAGLIPFLAFTAMMSDNQLFGPADMDERWVTLLPTEIQRYIILDSTFVVSVTTGGIHFVSLCISIYLALLFRKISRLPPDMNPLEDNLASRHKRNKSSVSTALTESSNRDSYLSAPLIDSPRNVPFVHTRNESTSSVSSPQRHSQQSPDAPFYQQPNSQRSSRANLMTSPERRSARTSTFERLDHPKPSSPLQKSSSDTQSEENWVSYPSPSPSPPLHEPPEFQHLKNRDTRQQQITIPFKYDYTNKSPRPLEMNPPTPPVTASWQVAANQRALKPINGNNSPAIWEDIDFQNDKSSLSHGPSNGAADNQVPFYGKLRGSVKRAARVVSSGIDGKSASGMRAREVSGKVAEEGRSAVMEYI